MPRLLAIAVAALALSVMTAVREASACSCVGEATPCSLVQSSDPNLLIFIGTPASAVAASQDVRRFTFVVDERVKGDVTDSIEIETAADTAACGYPFRIGMQYLVYALRTSAGVRVSFCSRTGPVASRQNDLALFKEVRGSRLQSRLKVTVARYSLLLDGFYLHDAPGSTGLPDVSITVRGPAVSREIRTDASGSFTLVGLPAGS